MNEVGAKGASKRQVKPDRSEGLGRPADSERRFSSLLDRSSLADLVAVVAVAGALAYAVLRIVYAQFYAEFSLQPEDVGLGQNEIIRQSLAGPTVLALVVAAIVVLMAMALILTVSVLVGARDDWRQLRSRLRERATAADGSIRPGPDVRRLGAHLTWLGHRCYESIDRTLELARRRSLLVALIAVGLVFAWLSDLADRAANNALDDGETIHILDREVGPLRLPLLDVQAVAARFSSTDPGVPVPTALTSPCLLYLGQANDVLAVYDVSEQVTYRIPNSHIMIELASDQDHVPDRCTNRQGQPGP